MQATKVRFTEYQAAIGLAQLQRLNAQTATRSENASYLKNKISTIPGILPYKLYNNVTRAAFHLFAFRYKKENFKDLPRAKFLKSLQAEGVPCSSGYTVLNTQPFLNHAFQSRAYQKIYPSPMLDFKRYQEKNKCPENEALCTDIVWIPQNVLLGGKSDMDDIAFAIEKIYKNAEAINKAI